jgi:hypothetical protein
MLTATGFTTKESELILRHPIRRRVALFMILFGVFSLAVIISSLSSFFAQHSKTVELAIVSAILLLILVLIKRPKFSEKLKERFIKDLEKDFELHELPIQEVLYINEHDLLTKAVLHKESKFIGTKANELFEPDEDLTLLFIQRGESYIRKDIFKEVLAEGDMLFLYGDSQLIADKFSEELKRHEEKLDDRNVAALET